MVTEAPIVIENRKELTYLLCQAAELEHGLMCEYLYACDGIDAAPDTRMLLDRVGAHLRAVGAELNARVEPV